MSSSDEHKNLIEKSEQHSTAYVIRTVEIEKAINYEDSNGHQRWLVMRLRAELGNDTSVPFVSTALERLIDSDLESVVKRTEGPKDKTLGEVLNGLQWFRSKKNPKLELTSYDCETYRLLVENITKQENDLRVDEYKYFILSDGKTVGRTRIE